MKGKCKKTVRSENTLHFIYTQVNNYILTYIVLCITMYIIRKEVTMKKTEWLSQVRKGLLEYSILAIISHKPVYGYDLISILDDHEALSTTEGTIYPLLRRLEKNGLIQSFWKETAPGKPPRRYYELAEKGIQTLEMMNTEWIKVVKSINEINENEVKQ